MDRTESDQNNKKKRSLTSEGGKICHLTFFFFLPRDSSASRQPVTNSKQLDNEEHAACEIITWQLGSPSCHGSADSSLCIHF